MSGTIATLGFGEETAYATAVTPNRFVEFVSEGVRGEWGRIESQGLSGSRVLRDDRFVPYARGGSGELQVEVMDRGMGFLLKHMLGTIATTAPAVAGDPYTHTATVGSLVGDSLTLQVGRPKIDDTLQAFTYKGCKITEWTLENEAEGMLLLTLGVDASIEDTATALASGTVPAGELLSYAGGTVSIGGVAVDVANISITGNNALNVDRRFLRGTTAKKEPVEEGWREYTWEMTMEFADMTHYNRVTALTPAGTLAAISAEWVAPSGAHSLKVDIPNARFDGNGPAVEGSGIVMASLTGKAVDDGVASPISFVYTTSDATP